MPAAIAGATSGTTTRFTTGERTARRPNETRMIGSVAACAASETPRLSASQWGRRPRPTDSIHAVSGVAQAISPAVANDDSWKPASPMRLGSVTRRSVAAQPSAAAARPARPVSRASKTTPAISAGPDDRCGCAGERHVRDDREDRHDRPSSAPETAGHGGDGGRNDRDVPAGDGDDVADPGGRERGSEVAVDAVAQADEDACGEARLGLGQDAGQGLAGATPQSFEPAPEVLGSRLHIESPGRERADRADPLQVLPVGRIGTFADRSVNHDRVAGDHDGIAGERGRDLDPGAGGRRRERRGLLAVARRADRLDDHPPRAVTLGRTVGRRRSGRHHRESHGDGRSTERDGEQRSDTEARPGLAQQQDRGEAQGDGRPEMVRCDLPRSDGRDDRPDRQAAAPAHVSEPSRDP